MNKKHLKAIAAAAIVAIAAAAAWAVHVRNQTRSQHDAIAALVGDATEELAEALTKGSAGMARADQRLETLRAMDVSRQRPFADAAEHYLISTRTIARASADAARLTRQAAADRQALAAHMGARRSDAWFAASLELKKRVEKDHFDLGLAYKALDEVLFSLAEDTKRLSAYVQPSQLLEDNLRASSRTRLKDEAAAAAAELEKARRLVP
jgi:hypothetical protein